MSRPKGVNTAPFLHFGQVCVFFGPVGPAFPSVIHPRPLQYSHGSSKSIRRFTSRATSFSTSDFNFL